MKKIIIKFILLIASIISLLELVNFKTKVESNQKLDTIAIVIEDSINTYGFINESTNALLEKHKIKFKSVSDIKKK